MVSPSPWPIQTSLSLFILALSAGYAMHNFYNIYYLVFFGVIMVILSMFF